MTALGAAGAELTGVLRAALGPLDPPSRPAAVTRRLQQAIALGLLPHGSPLPTEIELAGQLNVSTVTLRNSLQELRRQGLVVTRRGKSGGSFVNVPGGLAPDMLFGQLLEFDLDYLRDLRDFHATISGGAAGLAASRSRAQQLDHLRRAAELIASATSAAEIVHADVRFHLELAAASRSARLTNSEMEVQTEVASLLWIPGHEVIAPERAAEQHRRIAEAIADKDADQARWHAEQHTHEALSRLIDLRMTLDSRTGTEATER